VNDTNPNSLTPTPDRSAWKTRHGDTPADVTIGRVGKVSQGRFVPQVVSRKVWGRPDTGQDGSWFSLNHADTVVSGQEPETVGGRARLTVGNLRHEFYDLDGDRTEWAMVFASRPGDNVVRFRLKHSADLTFHYQPELPPEEVEAGFRRPDNVVGSYAVYSHRSGNVRNSRGELIEVRRTGKVAHLYRPVLIDANGNRQWAEMTIDGGWLYITMPGKWLDGAAYPVVLDPTFGYTSVGGSTRNPQANQLVAWTVGGPASDGTLDSVSVYVSSGKAATCGLYEMGASAPDALVEVGSEIDPTTSGWNTWTLAGTISVSSSKTYAVGWKHETGFSTYNYDSGSGTVYVNSNASTYSAGSLDDPYGTPTGTYGGRDPSAYATYTESGGATERGPFTPPFNRPSTGAFPA